MSSKYNINGDSAYPYIIDMECIGFFSVDSKLSKDEAMRGVMITAHGVLYGAIREAVAWITGRQPFGPLMLGLSEFTHAVVLRNIALYHHEAINGSCYFGMMDDDIPIEAKIVAVADVFDALTSVRPYKEAWSNNKAFMFLQSMAGTKFDIDCVTALITCRDQAENIQQRFIEDNLG